MAYDEELAERVRESFEDRFDVVERKMFGGLAFMFRGNMCCGVIKDDLMVRVGPEGVDELMELPNVRPMDFTGKSMTSFILVSAEGTAADEVLESWVHRGVAFASSLPPK